MIRLLSMMPAVLPWSQHSTRLPHMKLSQLLSQRFEIWNTGEHLAQSQTVEMVQEFLSVFLTNFYALSQDSNFRPLVTTQLV
jgi:hypothetical protein